VGKNGILVINRVRVLGSRLPAHPHPTVPGIHPSTSLLGAENHDW